LKKPGFILLCLIACAPAAADGLALKKDVTLAGSAAQGEDGAMFITADQIESSAANVVVASGHVEARQSGQNVFADWLHYDLALHEVSTRGPVRFEQPTISVTGNDLFLKMDDYSGTLDQPVYQLVATPGRGEATRANFVSQDQCKLVHATYTTCPLGNDDWYLLVDDLDLDRTREVGTAHGAKLEFLGVPILYTPWMNFSLDNSRNSGVLAPTFGTTQRNGLDLIVPVYLNLAPNYDATLSPRLMSKRGVQLGGEFRYLSEQFSGIDKLEYLPEDNLVGRSRWGAFLKHQQTLTPNLTAGFDFNRVSDNNYFRDLSNLVAATSQSYLNHEAWLTYKHDWWNVDLRAQRFQTLQDPAAPLTIPYDRLPQIRLDAAHSLPGGLEFNLVSEAVHFSHPTLVEGTRALAYPTLRLPLTNSFGFFTPQLGLHATRYNLDGNVPGGVPDTITRTIPIGSLDAGVVLDRPFSFMGRAFQQTLEPRLYYVYAPYRDQSKVPVFDTALLDFSYAQIFTENQFIGGDRVNDANQITLAVTSRFSEDASGIERLKVTLGQRYYFTSQQVTLPGIEARDKSASDLLAALSGQVTDTVRIDMGWQFNTDTGTTVRQSLSAAYRPAPGYALNFGYRTIDTSTNQVDVSAQWPLTRRLYGLFRYNYSFRDNKLVDGLAGLEYNGGCWALRGVIQRIATSATQSTSALFFQLELNGMGRIGSNPLDVLKQSVPGYRPSNELDQTP
jgi:LPS-assembly protein